MIAFFTSIGFLASFKLLKKGGKGVIIFLIIATVLLVIQNIVGVGLAKFFGLHPLMGVAAGSVSLTGGHGTSAAFAPIIENLIGESGALTVAIATSTYGLIMGCIIGGPIAKRLMAKYKITGNKEEDFLKHEDNTDKPIKELITENTLYKSSCYILIAMGFGMFFLPLSKKLGITLPAYIGAMIVAAIIRNYTDIKNINLPLHTIDTMGNIALQLFLTLALMSLKLWELASLAGPLVIILIAQTVIMILYAYFITFHAMGKNYDSVVITTGHCGFGLGATPNAMANMESFTEANGPSPTAFLVVPLVAALFIDFANASVITIFLSIFK